MNSDPFSVLGVSQSASEDEIKAAYRKLAKKFHPDVNQGSASSEAKMKEINEAYAEAMKIKRSGGTYTGQNSSQSGYGQGGYQRQNQSQEGGFGGFGGFEDFGFGGFGFGGSQNTSYQESSPELRAARNYINTGHYREALTILERVTERSAEWFYLNARANIGLGNRNAAATYAKQAATMEPDNFEYQSLVSRMDGSSANYRQRGQGFGGIPLNYCSNPCVWICFCNLLCNCCRGVGYGGTYCC